MKYAVYISGKSSRVHKFILKNMEKDLSDFKIVVSDDIIDKNLKCILEKKNILYYELPYSSLKGTSSEKNLCLSDFIKSKLDENFIDYCFVFGKHILSGVILEDYKNKIINFHPAILPMYPGVRAIDQAIEDDKAFLIGNTAHFIDEGVDTGPIIMQSVIPMKAFFDQNRNYESILDLQIEMLEKIIKLLQENRITVANNKTRIDGANYKTSFLFPDV